MLLWIRKNSSIIITFLISGGFALYCYGCEPTTTSLTRPQYKINRQELQLEFDQFIAMAKIRMLDLDKQEQFRAIILENALILVQGNAYNPMGIITGIAAIYGIVQGSNKVTKVVKTVKKRWDITNGTG